MAAHDVFNRASQNLADIIPVDAAKLAFASVGGGGAGGTFGVGMLTQNVQINYQQQISRLYEVGTNNTYFIGGRTQGQLALGRVIGPQAVQVTFYTKYGNMCFAKSNIMTLTAGNSSCAGGGPGSVFTIMYSVITSIGITVGAQDMIVNEQLQLMFVSLEVDQGATVGAAAGLGGGGLIPGARAA
jgi:hypothetical protein